MRNNQRKYNEGVKDYIEYLLYIPVTLMAAWSIEHWETFNTQRKRRQENQLLTDCSSLSENYFLSIIRVKGRVGIERHLENDINKFWWCKGWDECENQT